MHNSIDELLALQRLQVDGRTTKALCILEIIWCPPLPGWLKVNMDGAAFGGPSLAGCAGVFRTCRNFINVALLFPLAFALISRLSWLLLSTRLSMSDLLIEGNYGWRATQLT